MPQINLMGHLPGIHAVVQAEHQLYPAEGVPAAYDRLHHLGAHTKPVGGPGGSSAVPRLGAGPDNAPAILRGHGVRSDAGLLRPLSAHPLHSRTTMKALDVVAGHRSVQSRSNCRAAAQSAGRLPALLPRRAAAS
jgi:hypothetical protein